MNKIKRDSIWYFFILAFLSGCDTVIGGTRPDYYGTVTAVIDGDTLAIRFDDEKPDGCSWQERVRLIGVDTPELYTEPPEYYAQEARDFACQILRRQVRIEFDTVSARRDRYGRLLAYIYVPEHALSLNELLIEEGYGYYYGYFAFEGDKMQQFQYAEEDARIRKRGLWK
jgi:micrococcal nuclease